MTESDRNPSRLNAGQSKLEGDNSLIQEETLADRIRAAEKLAKEYADFLFGPLKND